MYTAVKIKDQVSLLIQSSLQKKKFEVKKGNTLATLAMVMNRIHCSWYGNSKDVRYDSQAAD